MPSVLFDNIGELLTNAGDPLSDAAMVVDGDSVQHAFPGATALMAVARPGRLRVFPGDDRWARSIEQAASGRVPLIGVHLVTPAGSLPISEPEAA